ncbi:MAG: tripartite tricarboxylate transporter substrate binding protein [Betaproteobacteria bacterium]|nr:tripartite tricarboxylate transporter substrate binding protein [Betaproteobacteria bacterium]
MSIKQRFAVAAGVSTMAMLGGSAAFAQQPFPNKPVRVIVVFPAGGATDVVSRLVFQKVGEQVGQQFIIDNRGGAGGTLGAAVAAKSPPDGYTLMVYSATLMASAHLYRTLPYHALHDFTGITSLTRLVGALAVHPSLPVRNVKDLVALAKARPGELRYGSAGIGAYQHLAASFLATMAGIDMAHVPYKGGGIASTAAATGEIQLMLTPVAEVQPHLQSGRLRAIAVSSPTRTTQFPDLPAIGETVKGYDFVSWFGAFAPAGTPRPVIDRLNAELRKAVAHPDVAARLSALVLDPMHSTPEEFAKLLKAEYDKYERVVKLSGARLE